MGAPFVRFGEKLAADQFGNRRICGLYSLKLDPQTPNSDCCRFSKGSVSKANSIRNFESDVFIILLFCKVCGF